MAAALAPAVGLAAVVVIAGCALAWGAKTNEGPAAIVLAQGSFLYVKAEFSFPIKTFTIDAPGGVLTGWLS
jgi:hypothetical protein